jgi:rifampicin phosphotransferase
MESSSPELHWSSANVGEAMPGVLTPLGWTLWGPTVDPALRRAWQSAGILSRSEVEVDPEDRLVRVFFGRAALLVDLFAEIGNRMPGATAEMVVTNLFGEMPETLSPAPTVRRYPFIAVGVPRNHVTIRRRLRSAAAGTERWWRRSIESVDVLGLAAAIALFEDASRRFSRNITLQTLVAFCAIQPLLEALDSLTRRLDVGDVATLSGGYGDVPETAVVRDLWRASRGVIDLDEVVRRHGFHGPMEGEISARVWRDDPSPLRRLVEEYARRADDEDPATREAARRQERERMETQLLAAAPGYTRPAVRALLSRAATCIPLRGVAKGAFLMALDVARASARRAGECLVADGVLEHREDAFFLTVEELTRGLPDDAREVVATRRRQRAEYESVRLPEHWRGIPEALPAEDQPIADGPMVFEGTGVSGGRVEGTVRVVLDPTTAEVQQDEILVAPTTDPSWSSIMFISSALVVDIGGMLSHAAVVARELGIPCVVNTQNGSRALRTGDRVRVDGDAGRVEILARAAELNSVRMTT